MWPPGTGSYGLYRHGRRTARGADASGASFLAVHHVDLRIADFSYLRGRIRPVPGDRPEFLQFRPCYDASGDGGVFQKRRSARRFEN